MAQRMHGGAALQHIPLATPGFKGLNTEAAGSLLGPEWATELQNAVVDNNNRLAGRKGWEDITTSPNGAAFETGFEYYQHDGSTEIHMATATAIARSTDEGVSFSDVTGTASFTDGNWQFHNFANKVVALQENKAPIVYSGTTYSHIADVNAPQGRAGTVFGGRLWIADADGHTMKWSALLDETDWTSADSGSFDFQNVWQGTDVIKAITSHNGLLVVMGEHNIVLLTDGAGSALGINPTNAYVLDILTGIGCIARDSVQQIEGDLWFVSHTGLMSLGRLIQERSNPINNLSKNVRSAMIADLNFSTFDITDLRSVYSPKDRFYLLSLPRLSGSSEGGTTWAFDTRGIMEDGAARCFGNWSGLIPTVLFRRQNNKVISANRANVGELFEYDTYNDDLDTYTFIYRGGWTDLGAPGITKIFKRFAGVFFSDQGIQVNFKWAFDFADLFSTRSKVFTGDGTVSNWGAALWGTGVWGGGVQLREGKSVPGGSGEYLKWGIDVIIDGQQFSIQQLELYAKLGRLG